MKVGFTGTQVGTTEKQRVTFLTVITELQPTEFHHGCCIGADEDCFAIAVHCCSKLLTVAHPPLFKTKMFPRAVALSSCSRAAKDYLDRNQDIVDETEVLVACPKEFKEELRSGTWATIRRARKAKKRIIYIWPDGTKTDTGVAK